MNTKTNTMTINKLIYISILVLIICLIFVVSKYIGLDILLLNIVNSFTPVFIAILVSFLVEPLIGLFITKGVKRKYSVLLSYSILIVIVGLILFFTIPSLIEQIQVFISKVPSLIGGIEQFINNFGGGFGSNIGNILNNIFIGLYSSFFKILGSSLSIVYNILLGLSGAVFLSFDFPIFRNNIKKYIPRRIKEPVIYYFKNFLPFVHKYFFCMLIDTAFIFIISIIGFSVIGIDYVLVITLFISITNLIPIIGPYIGGIPAVIIGFSVSNTLGISALIVVIIVQFIESVFLQPIILKNVISLHPLEGILGISLFGVIFGVIGMILSPILIVAFKLLFLPYEVKEGIKNI